MKTPRRPNALLLAAIGLISVLAACGKAKTDKTNSGVVDPTLQKQDTMSTEAITEVLDEVQGRWFADGRDINCMRPGDDPSLPQGNCTADSHMSYSSARLSKDRMTFIYKSMTGYQAGGNFPDLEMKDLTTFQITSARKNPERRFTEDGEEYFDIAISMVPEKIELTYFTKFPAFSDDGCLLQSTHPTSINIYFNKCITRGEVHLETSLIFTKSDLSADFEPSTTYFLRIIEARKSMLLLNSKQASEDYFSGNWLEDYSRDPDYPSAEFE